MDYDPGASEVNQLNRIKLMLATAQKNLKTESSREDRGNGRRPVLPTAPAWEPCRIHKTVYGNYKLYPAIYGIMYIIKL